MKQKKVKPLILISVVIIILICLFIYLYPFTYSNIQNDLGNTMSNIENNGYASQKNDIVFYSNYSDNGSLYMYNKKTAESKKLTDRKVSNINIIGNWLYYFSKGQPGRVYRMKLGSESNHAITLKNYYKITTTDKYIFVIESEEGKEQKLYRMNLNGANKKMILSNLSRYFDINSGFIYFSNGNDDYSLYECDYSGKNLKKISNRKVSRVYRFGDYLYCVDNNCSYVFKKNINNSEEIVIYNGEVHNMNISKNGIIFSNNNQMIFMDLNGKNVKIINKGVFDSINVIDKCIIYRRPVNWQDKKSGVFISDINGQNEQYLDVNTVKQLL